MNKKPVGTESVQAAALRASREARPVLSLECNYFVDQAATRDALASDSHILLEMSHTIVEECALGVIGELEGNSGKISSLLWAAAHLLAMGISLRERADSLDLLAARS